MTNRKARDGQAWRPWVAERVVVPLNPVTPEEVQGPISSRQSQERRQDLGDWET